MSTTQDFGVCRLAIIPTHEQPDYRSLQINQLLFGEHYEVTGVRDNWVSIQHAFDDSIGWIPLSQHHSISKEYFEQINSSDYKITTDLASTMLYNKFPINIVMGSVVPISNSELFKMEEQLAFNGESKSLSQKRDVEFLKTILFKYGNAPYLPGGKSPFGIDASGLVQMVFKISGYRLPRTVDKQMQSGLAISDFDNATPGDIIFLKNLGGDILPSILHSAGKVILVDSHSHPEVIDARGVKLLDLKKYSWDIHAIRRVI